MQADLGIQSWGSVGQFLQVRRVRLGHAFVVLLLLLAKPTWSSVAIGACVSACGVALRFWAAGYIAKNAVLCMSGPYAYVRNPLYVGSFVMSLGYCIAANVAWMSLLYAPLFGLIYYVTILREEELLKHEFGSNYSRYMQDVPRFIPQISPAKLGQEGHFSMQKAIKNHEQEALLWSLAFFGLMAAGTSMSCSLLEYVLYEWAL